MIAAAVKLTAGLILIIVLTSQQVNSRRNVVCKRTPVHPKNGYVEHGGSWSGASRQVKCNSGYSLQGQQYVTCLKDGSWTLPGKCGTTEEHHHHVHSSSHSSGHHHGHSSSNSAGHHHGHSSSNSAGHHHGHSSAHTASHSHGHSSSNKHHHHHSNRHDKTVIGLTLGMVIALMLALLIFFIIYYAVLRNNTT